MKRKESAHSRRMSKHSKRKESISSSKSDMASESESYYDSFLPIKKEVQNYIIIDKKFYEKLIKYIENTNLFKEKLKNKLKKLEKKEYIQSSINEMTIISTTSKNKLEQNNNLENNTNKTINNNNSNSMNLNDSKNNSNNEKNNNINKNGNIDNNINNKPKVNPNTSMMSLFMNSQKEKAKEKEEIAKLKLLIEEMTKKHENEINNYKQIIKEFSIKIDTLQKELKNLKEINEKYKQKENYNKQKVQIVLSHPKILSKMISYLNTNEKLSLSKCNNYLFQNIYFRAVTEQIYNKLKLREKILEKFESQDLSTNLEVKEKEILDLFKNYIIEQKISGKEMRNEIVKSLIFIETYVKIPLSNFKGPLNNSQNIEKKEEPKMEKFFNKFLSAIKSEIKEEIGIYNNEYLVKNNYITIPENEFVNISDNDKHVLETFHTDKSLNVKFEYTSANNIKDIINDFFICQLPQPTYQKFIQKICETFCNLLYSSFLALNDIKNLQIIIFSLYARYMKYKVKVEYQQSIIDDLHHFADSSREIKEMLTKTKNELEFKYTNSLMTISQLNNVLIEKEKEINNLKSKAKEKEEKYDKYKNEIIKEYQKIKDDFNLTKNQRDSLKGILNELKDFFVKVVSGELLN